jgi:hypothetical protein
MAFQIVLHYFWHSEAFGADLKIAVYSSFLQEY